jgi:HEXXH motif-containing protein
MKSYVGALLDRGGWQAYDAWLLGRITEVMDRARDGDHEDAADALRNGFAQLELLETTNLLREGTPFLWMNIHRLYRLAKQARPAQAVRDTLVTAFDSYFHLLPDGTCFAIPNAERPALVLPRLGVALPNVHNAKLRRLSSQTLAIEGPIQSLIIDLAQQHADCDAHMCRVFDESTHSVIAIADPSVAATVTMKTVSNGDVRKFADNIRRGMTLIGSIDCELHRSIQKLVQWFVPLRMSSPDVHLSHSDKDLIGVIHLSEGYTGIRLAEAIVHEFHHNELFVLEATHELSHHDGSATFYSPWRSDPRPLSGLLHAIHVFSAITKFYRLAEATSADIDRDAAYERRSELCQKLRIGLMQVPHHLLSPLGKRFLDDIDGDLALQESELSPVLSKEILDHARTWCTTNPDCVKHLSWPGNVRNLVKPESRI